MSIISELMKTISSLAAIEKRTEDVLNSVVNLHDKVDRLSDRVTRLESDQAYLRESVKNEILAEIKSDIVEVKLKSEIFAMQFDHKKGLSKK